MSPSKTRPRRLTVYREPISAEQAQFAEQLCRAVAAIDSPLALERLTSWLLGHVWERRHIVSEECDIEVAMLAVGERIVESLVEQGGREAKVALTAVAQIDRGPLGLLAAEMAASLTAALIPDWVTRVGTVRIVKTFTAPGPGVEEALLLVPDATAEPHMLAVFITERGVAKHLSLTKLFDPTDPSTVPGECGPGSTLAFRPVDDIPACRRVRLAIERSDDSLGRQLGPEFADHRALALARITPPHPAPALPIQVVRKSPGKAERATLRST